MQRRGGQRRDPRRRPQDEVDAEPQPLPDQGVEPQRIERRAQHGARHREQFDHREREWIADQHIGAEFVEVVGHERSRGAGRASRGEQGPRRSVARPVQPAQEGVAGIDARLAQWIFLAAGVGRPRREPRLEGGHEARDGGERQLETRAQDRFRLEQDDKKRREGEVAHAHRLTVEQHRAQHDQRHEQRAFGADARARAKVVGDRPGHRQRRRPFLDGIMQRQGPRHRQQAAQSPIENPGHQRHLHAGDGDDVEDAGLADDIARGVVEKIALARHHRGADRARGAADHALDAPRQRVAHAVDASEKAQAHPGGRWRVGALDPAQRVADRAQPREIGVAGEVVAARQRRARRRHQPRGHFDEVAGGDIEVALRRQPHAVGRRGGVEPFGRRDAQHKARALAAEIHLLQPARDFDDAHAVEHGRRHAPRSQRSAGDAAKQRGERHEQTPGRGLFTREKREAAERREHQRRI